MEKLFMEVVNWKIWK